MHHYDCRWPKAKPGSTEASYAERQIASGRLICDTYICAKDLVRCRNYSLQTLVETQLQQSREDMDYQRVGDYLLQAGPLVHLLRHAEKDAFYQMMLTVQLMILPLTKQLTNIAGNLWSRTLIGARAERNEFLLLHEFHRLKYICPDKEYSMQKEPVTNNNNDDEKENDRNPVKGGGRRKATYAGGLVLEPKKGLYSNIVLLLDFNSLYPSIIQEFNICFTTIERDSSAVESEIMPNVPEAGTPQGVLPKILATLVARRREIKRLMKDPKLAAGEYSQLHIRQQALKLTANSMYGCLGFAHSRFHARPLAMLITGKGREILQNTVELAQGPCKLDVIYGDTDSVMVHTGTKDLKEARAMGQVLKKAVNERYRLLEIELDGVFEKLLLLKKKKYAAVVLEELADGTLYRKLETKGLDLVRRDWCSLSVDTSNAVLEKIIGQNSGGEDVVESIHALLRQVATDVANDVIPLEKYVISKNLTKEPEQYGDAKNQPHVTVALRMKERGMAVRAGDTIPYVIICGASCKEGPLSERAYHPDDVRKEHLNIDKGWYLAQQVHPCVVRLCEHLPGTDAGIIAASLGLDATKYQSRILENDGEDSQVRLSFTMTEEERFRTCKPLNIVCNQCDKADGNELKGLLVLSDNGVLVKGLTCTGCHQNIPIFPTIYYQLRGAIKRDLDEYYLGWMECDEVSCRFATRQIRVYENQCPIEGCRGTMQSRITGQRLYTQLLYYRSLIDIERARLVYSKMTDVPPFKWQTMVAEVEPLREAVQTALSKCSYPIIHLTDIFLFMHAPSGHRLINP